MHRYEIHTAGGAPPHARIAMSTARRQQAIRTTERLVVFGQRLRHRTGVVGTSQQIRSEAAKLRAYYTSGLIYFCREGTDEFVSLQTILMEADTDEKSARAAKKEEVEAATAKAVELAKAQREKADKLALDKRVAAEKAALAKKGQERRDAQQAAKLPEPEAIPPVVEEDEDDLRELITVDLTMGQLKAICKMVTPVVKSSSSKKATVTKIHKALDGGGELDSKALEDLLSE